MPLVPRLSASIFDMEGVGEMLVREGLALPIACENWPAAAPHAGPDRRLLPCATAWMAHREDQLLLHFRVEELGVRATFGRTHDEVWNDSCVELFLALPGEPDGYYNFEFNAVGTCLVCFGASRTSRVQVPERLVDGIQRHASLGRAPFGFREGIQTWTLTVALPASAFFQHALTDFGGLRIRANLYKCGNQLPSPHYLSWAPIPSPQPDFHRPEAFAELACE